MRVSLALLLLLLVTACSETMFAADAQLPDGSKYYGELLDGQFHGPGKLVYPTGAFYEGQFDNGLFHGPGVFLDQRGNRYDGDFKEGLATGRFTVTLVKPEIHYEGDLVDGWFHGEGIFTSATEHYEGGFADNVFHGEGELELPDQHYEGSFKEGKYHGNGVLVFYDEGVEFARYCGEFMNSAMHGNGTYTDDEWTYQGEFTDGDFTGQGVMSSTDGSRLSGQFLNWELHGSGERVDADGNLQKGDFSYGFLSGEGQVELANGDNYRGNFDYGELSGEGVFKAANGDVYKGEFKYGRFHGQGSYTAADESGAVSQTGLWENGRFTGEQEYTPGQGELALKNYHRLIDGFSDSLIESDKNQANTYFLAIAGDGSESVFRREVEFVSETLSEKYDLEKRSLLLVNHHDSAELYPLATQDPIQQAITALADKMDTENDVLILYLTSHGNKGGVFSLQHNDIKLTALTAENLSNMLAAAQIKWKLIMVSACYAGSFIPYFDDNYTAILTAADADNTSFGCSEESEGTYFGRALFQETLAQNINLSIDDAFNQAAEIIKQWENEQEITYSSPQIRFPDAIKAKLGALSQ